MSKVIAKYPAPLHDGDMAVQLVADAPQAAYVNALTLGALGEVPVAADGSQAAARGVTDAVRQEHRPVHALLERIKALTPEVRTRLTRDAERNLYQQTGRQIALDETSPSAPLVRPLHLRLHRRWLRDHGIAQQQNP